LIETIGQREVWRSLRTADEQEAMTAYFDVASELEKVETGVRYQYTKKLIELGLMAFAD